MQNRVIGSEEKRFGQVFIKAGSCVVCRGAEWSGFTLQCNLILLLKTT